MTMPVLGLDTSNYTTSAAVFDGADGRTASRRCGPESWDCGRATPCSSM